jgi:hypothetical protein
MSLGTRLNVAAEIVSTSLNIDALRHHEQRRHKYVDMSDLHRSLFNPPILCDREEKSTNVKRK